MCSIHLGHFEFDQLYFFDAENEVFSILYFIFYPIFLNSNEKLSEIDFPAGNNSENPNLHLFHFRKYLYKHTIQRDIRDYILRNFIEITKVNEDIMRLSLADLVDLLSDDALNANNEQSIWEFCLRWIEFDEKSRIGNVPSLLECVRLGLMNQDVSHVIIGCLAKASI